MYFPSSKMLKREEPREHIYKNTDLSLDRIDIFMKNQITNNGIDELKETNYIRILLFEPYLNSPHFEELVIKIRSNLLTLFENNEFMEKDSILNVCKKHLDESFYARWEYCHKFPLKFDYHNSEPESDHYYMLSCIYKQIDDNVNTYIGEKIKDVISFAQTNSVFKDGMIKDYPDHIYFTYNGRTNRLERHLEIKTCWDNLKKCKYDITLI